MWRVNDITHRAAVTGGSKQGMSDSAVDLAKGERSRRSSFASGGVGGSVLIVSKRFAVFDWFSAELSRGYTSGGMKDGFAGNFFRS